MIYLPEQYGYKNPSPIEGIEKYDTILSRQNFSKTIQRRKNGSYCFDIRYVENSDKYLFETSYFVGVDWIVENRLPIYVKPKLENGNEEIDYIKTLFEILNEPENYNHLDELCEIDFDRPTIKINQNEDLLTPLLIIQYINILKKIVQKGLRKSYYTVRKNLNSKIKGKILVNETIKRNHFNSKLLFSYCEFSEFGINTIENILLKKALTFSVAALQNLHGIDKEKVSGTLKFIQPAFALVDNDANLEDLKYIKPNKLYKEYEQALKFAKYILKRYGYNISNTNSTVVSTPPFWIDMSKLFELFVYSKLKEKFTSHNEVTYHKWFNYLQPDFIINSNDGGVKLVVDAKYKPRYEENNISTEDIRQISGYARLQSVYDFLRVPDDTIIDCLVIYSTQNTTRVDFKGDNFNFEPESRYKRFFKIGIRLPVK